MSENLEQIIQSYVNQNRSIWRWNLFFKAVFWLFMLTVIFFQVIKKEGALITEKHVALINIRGVIGESEDGIAQNIIDRIDDAFKNTKTLLGIILQINSPGGSAVHSDMVYRHIIYLKNKHPDIPFYAVCSDMCASGGYYIAAATNEIYTNKMTITGSIGVIFQNFGLVDALDKIGVQPRTYTAGKDKAFMSMFLKENPEHITKLNTILENTHEVFIEAVKMTRGDKLAVNQVRIFSGEPFSGIEAKELGLIDGFASVNELMREKFKDNKLIDYSKESDLIEKITKRIRDKLTTSLKTLLTYKLYY